MILFFAFMSRRGECVGMGSALQGSSRHMQSIGVSPWWSSSICNSEGCQALQDTSIPWLPTSGSSYIWDQKLGLALKEPNDMSCVWSSSETAHHQKCKDVGSTKCSSGSAFYSLLMRLSDCDTVVLKGALNYGVWIAVVRFCTCNMGSQKANVPWRRSGWHIWVIILLLLLFTTLEFLMAQVKQCVKRHEPVFIDVI
jgi:hypothetical protein